MFLRIHQHFFTSCATAVDVNGGPNAFVDQSTVQYDLEIARSFEFFENNVVHLATRVDQCRSDDR